MGDLAIKTPALQTLATLAQTWEGPRADDFSQALVTFIASHASEHTRKSYSFALRQFWQWYLTRTGRCPVPSEIGRTEATAYATWLREESDEAIELQLRSQGDTLGLLIYRTVRDLPGAHIDDIRPALAQGGITISSSAKDIDKLDRVLAKLVMRRLLVRKPSFEEACKQDREMGCEITLDYRPDPGIFAYTVAPRGKSSPTTIAIRLYVLSSFWDYLADTGENIAGGRPPLLLHNIWRKLARKASKRVRNFQRISRARSTPTLELFIQLLATTFRHSHKEPQQAAEAVVRKGEITPGDVPGKIYDLRDRALLLVLLFTGLRADEVSKIRRKDLALQDGGNGLLVVTGKGDKTRALIVPGPALAAVGDFERRLVALAEAARQNSRSSPRTRILDHPDAALLPGLKHWGANASDKPVKPSEIQGLTQSGIVKMLKRRARVAGLTPASEDWKKLGVHGIRHLAAHYALDRGVPLPIIQEVLGHESLSTTGIYLEQRELDKLTLWPEVGESSLWPG